MTEVPSKDTVLKREIGLFSATAIGMGAIIGAGIFVVTGIAAGLAGPAIIVSIIVAGAIALFTALSFSELSAYLPREGGAYIFAHELISARAGFITGWMWIFSNVFAGAAVSLGFAHYFVAMFHPLPVKLVAAAACLFFTILNYLGVRKSAILNNMLVSIKILILFVFVTLGVRALNSEHFTPFAPMGLSGVLQGSSLIFFAYTGFARITIVAEEVKEPRRTVPLSMVLALGISALIYLFISFVAVGLVGYVDLSRTGSPLAEAISVTGSDVAVFLISIGAVVATASVLLTTVLGVSRVAFSMARNGDLPRFLGNIHPKHKTPYYAVWVTGFLMIAAVISADLTSIVAVSTFASLLYYLIGDLAALRLPRKSRRYPTSIPAIALLSCVGLIAFLSINSWMIGLIGLGLGAIYYEAQRKLRLSR